MSAGTTAASPLQEAAVVPVQAVSARVRRAARRHSCGREAGPRPRSVVGGVRPRPGRPGRPGPRPRRAAARTAGSELVVTGNERDEAPARQGSERVATVEHLGQRRRQDAGARHPLPRVDLGERAVEDDQAVREARGHVGTRCAGVRLLEAEAQVRSGREPGERVLAGRRADGGDAGVDPALGQRAHHRQGRLDDPGGDVERREVVQGLGETDADSGALTTETVGGRFDVPDVAPLGDGLDEGVDGRVVPVRRARPGGVEAAQAPTFEQLVRVRCGPTRLGSRSTEIHVATPRGRDAVQAGPYG